MGVEDIFGTFDVLYKTVTVNFCFFPAVHLAQMVNTVRLHLNAALATHACMEDDAKTLVQVSIVLVQMITLVLVASMNMMHVLQEHAAMGPPVLTVVLVIPVSVHMVTLVS